jgi:hypothetical protein
MYTIHNLNFSKKKDVEKLQALRTVFCDANRQKFVLTEKDVFLFPKKELLSAPLYPDSCYEQI